MQSMVACPSAESHRRPAFAGTPTTMSYAAFDDATAWSTARHDAHPDPASPDGDIVAQAVRKERVLRYAPAPPPPVSASAYPTRAPAGTSSPRRTASKVRLPAPRCAVLC